MDTFTRAYIEAMLWAETDDADEPLERNYSAEDIAAEAMQKIMEDCASFQDSAGDMIDTDICRAGHDFWLTRNGHGAGFWDGDWPEHGDKLTELAKSYREVSPYVGDDGKIYLG